MWWGAERAAIRKALANIAAINSQVRNQAMSHLLELQKKGNACKAFLKEYGCGRFMVMGMRTQGFLYEG
jgi:hypothetical protein